MECGIKWLPESLPGKLTLPGSMLERESRGRRRYLLYREGVASTGREARPRAHNGNTLIRFFAGVATLSGHTAETNEMQDQMAPRIPSGRVHFPGDFAGTVSEKPATQEQGIYGVAADIIRVFACMARSS
jgi:hypothetical protein